ncbi:MAG: hypothetical protein JW731_06245 [Bacteroidales bacterium]|nr:hypothetical protein [Bacteroidales bacterium]
MKNNYYTKLLLLLTIFIVTGYTSHSQSITLPDLTANPGDNVAVAVNTSGLSNVAVVKLYIYFDSDVLTYTGYSNVWSGASTTLVNYIPSQSLVTTQFFSFSTGVNFPEGKYLDLNFTFNGGNTDLAFDQVLSKVQAYPDLSTIPTDFNDGSVSQPSVTFNLTVFLEGAYEAGSGGTMRTDLSNAGLIPMVQPFNQVNYYNNPDPAWFYDGSDQVTAIPPNTVDWVLVELRDAASAAQATNATIVAQKPCFLMSNGTIRDLDGTSIPRFYTSFDNGAFVVIWHRNHLGIMSANAVAGFGGAYSYNFSTGSNKVAGGANGYKQLETGVWGMAAGDIDADKQIGMNDKSNGWETDAALRGYNGSDNNLDSQSNNPDKNEFYITNLNKVSGIPN